MDSDHFGKPVRFLLDAGHWIEIRGVIEALAFMRTRWPDEGGDLYEHALDGVVTLTAAWRQSV